MELDLFLNQIDLKIVYVNDWGNARSNNFKESSSRQSRRFHGRKINKNNWELGPRVAFEIKEPDNSSLNFNGNLSVV
jgi:hypothetical protein